MLTNMRGTILSDPELREVENPKGGEDLKVVDVLIAYQKDEESRRTPVRCVAWGEAAEQLAQKKKDEEIEFAGNLTYSDYKNASMEKPRKILGFTIVALDESKTLCQKMEKFMGVERRPDEKPGAIFQPMRGKLIGKPELTQITGKDGQPLAACNATLRFWNGRSGASDVLVSLSAYAEAAEELAKKEKGDSIQFVGRLDSRPYVNAERKFTHMELCYNVISIDEEHKLLKETEKFIREQTGMKARQPLTDKIKDANDRKSVDPVSKPAPTPELAVAGK